MKRVRITGIRVGTTTLEIEVEDSATEDQIVEVAAEAIAEYIEFAIEDKDGDE